MKSNRLIIFFTLLLIFNICNLIYAEDTVVEAYVDRNQVQENDVFRYTIEVRAGDIKNFQKPDLSNIPFEVLSSSTSTSSSFSMVNGQVSSQKTEKITYTLLSKEKGQKQIPAITVSVNNKKFVTNPILVTITDQIASQQQNRGRQHDSSNISGNDSFLLATVDKTTAYKNEQIVVNYKLYSTTSQVSNISLGNEPAFSGFWKEELFQPSRPQMQREIYEGKQYYTLLLRTIALFPSREGRLVIPEMDVRMDIVIPSRSFFDFDTRRSINLKSKSIPVTIKALPALDNSKNFINAVGKFEISSSISETSGEEGNSLTYRITVTGSGNYNQVNLPSMPEARGLRFLSPEISDVNNNTRTSFSGSRTFTYPVILTESGKSVIPQITYSWFDPVTKSYKSKTLKAIEIDIKPSSQQVITTQGSQQSIRVLGRDIKFINLNPSRKNFTYAYKGFWFWFVGVICLLSLMAHYFYNLETMKIRSDLHYSRNRRANLIIKKYLKEAEKCVIEKSNNFYDFAYQGLIHYLTDKLNIPRGVQEKEVLENLTERGFSQSLITQLHTFLNTLNMIKYSNSETVPEKIDENALILKELVQLLLEEFNNLKKRSQK